MKTYLIHLSYEDIHLGFEILDEDLGEMAIILDRKQSNIEYYLMNKNRKIAKISIEDDNVYIDELYENLPLYTNNTWLNNRLKPSSRANILKLSRYAKINTREDFVFLTKAISLNDTFWVNNTQNWMCWEQVNPFVNDFSRIISNIDLNGEYNQRNCNFQVPSPEYTLRGSVPKCWKRDSNTIYLYKTDETKWSDLSGNRPYCEYYSSQVATALGISNRINYDIESYKNGNEIKSYVKCRIFTNERYGFIPIGDTKLYNLEIEKLVDELLQCSPKDTINICEMLLLDAIILNNDRHLENYGFIFDNDSSDFNIVSVAPIFDNDMSLGAKKSIQNKQFEDVYNELLMQTPQTGSFEYTEQGKYALRIMHKIKDNTIGLTYGQLMVQRMKTMYPFKFKRLPNKETDVSDNRIQFMEYIVNKQIKEILR